MIVKKSKMMEKRAKERMMNFKMMKIYLITNSH
jgi:hypothetical protein